MWPLSMLSYDHMVLCLKSKIRAAICLNNSLVKRYRLHIFSLSHRWSHSPYQSSFFLCFLLWYSWLICSFYLLFPFVLINAWFETSDPIQNLPLATFPLPISYFPKSLPTLRKSLLASLRIIKHELHLFDMTQKSFQLKCHLFAKYIDSFKFFKNLINYQSVLNLAVLKLSLFLAQNNWLLSKLE